jgi:hypothetical protein
MLAKLDAHHERMIAMMDSQLEKMVTCPQKTKATDLEANQKGMESKAEHEEVSKEEAAVDTFGAVWRSASSCRVLLKAKEMDQGQQGVSGEVHCCLQRGDPLCIPAWCKGQGCIKNLERTDVREETSGKTRRHQWNKGLRLKEATMSEEGEYIQQDLQENHRAGDHEANSRVFCQDSKNE